jgi:uncharacterized protein (DUF2249 family)/mannose-6-phosphate isomerase-like protein (cupin superfamily)
MQKQSLHDLIEFDNHRFNPKVLANEPGYRMVLLSLRAGQSVPEHSTKGKVTVYAMQGHVTFYEGNASCELHAGEVVSVEPGMLHRVFAHDDSALLVLATGKAEPPVDPSEELDLRAVPRPERHPLIFSKFDALAVGDSLRLLNDHDPVPLNRQFESIRSGQATWEYIERGPSLFRIRIRRVGMPSPLDVPLGAPSQHLQIETGRITP